MSNKLLLGTVLLVCVLSFVLLSLDGQWEQGLLNSFGDKKNETEQSQTPKEPETSPAPASEETLEKPKTAQAAVEAEQETTEAARVAKKTTVPSPSTTTQESTQKTQAEQKTNAAIHANFLVVIDPGHQQRGNLATEPIGPGAKEAKPKVTGGTTGTVTKKPEYVLNLEASLLLKSILEKRDIQVVMTRTSHNLDISNRERAEIANRNQADLFVRMHADGSESASTNGFSILVPAKESPYTKAIFEDSHLAGKTVLKHVSKEMSIHSSGIFFRSDMSGFNWSKVPVILPEIGFMTNPQEDRKLSDPVYLTALMEMMADGIEEYAILKSTQ